jgi:hypothetical protein
MTEKLGMTCDPADGFDPRRVSRSRRFCVMFFLGGNVQRAMLKPAMHSAIYLRGPTRIGFHPILVTSGG